MSIAIPDFKGTALEAIGAKDRAMQRMWRITRDALRALAEDQLEHLKSLGAKKCVVQLIATLMFSQHVQQRRLADAPVFSAPAVKGKLRPLMNVLFRTTEQDQADAPPQSWCDTVESAMRSLGDPSLT
jgi:hypothetical protein